MLRRRAWSGRASGPSILLDAAGLGEPLWYFAGISIDLLLLIARTVGNASGAVATLASWAFGTMVVGGLWLCLWRTRARLLGIVPFATGAVGAAAAPAPDLLVTGDGKHLAVVATDGTPRILRNRSGDYIREIFAETAGFDGEPKVLEDAPFAACSHDACVANVVRNGRAWRVLATRSSAWLEWEDMIRACADADIAVSDRWLPRSCTPRWLKLDRKALERTGGVAIYLDQKPRVVTVAERVDEHPWARSIK